jgi:hypothetical protein
VVYLLYLVRVPFQMFEEASPIKDSMLFGYAIKLGAVLTAIFRWLPTGPIIIVNILLWRCFEESSPLEVVNEALLKCSINSPVFRSGPQI